MSDYVMIASTEIPLPPLNLEKVSTESNKTAITVSWDEVASTAMPITGYLLQMADYGSADFKTVFNGTNQPSVMKHT